MSWAMRFARQPILDAQGQLAGYELLTRGAAPLSAVTELPLHETTGGAPAYVDADPDVLAAVDPLPFGPEGVVLELPADARVGPVVAERLARLRDHGYRLVLDGPLDGADATLVGVARGVKLTPGELLAARGAPAAGMTVIAHGVRTHEEHRACAEAGAELFQGDFYCRPSAVRAADIPEAGLARLRGAAAVGCGEGIDALERAIAQDPALSLRLLRFVNSAAFSLRAEVTSVRHAIALLGERTVRQWAALLLLSGGAGPPGPAAVTGLARARTCEALARRLGMGDPEAYFLVGMLSVADGLLDAPMALLLADLPLADDLAAALLTRAGGKGRALACAEACERGAWDDAELPGLDGDLLASLHGAALRWADAAAAGLV